MSVKKEASGRRSVQVEVEVPGTPEEVWRGHRHRTGDFVVVGAGGVRGARW